MKRMSLLLMAIVLLFDKTKAQVETNTDFITQMNTAFSALEKNRVPNGLLLDERNKSLFSETFQLEIPEIKNDIYYVVIQYFDGSIESHSIGSFK